MDQAAVRAAVSMDSGDLVALFNEYKLRAFHFALQMVGNREDAMDLTQEAFLRLHRHWDRRDTSRPLAPWLYAVLRNLAIDLLRRRSSHKECDAAEATEESAGPGPEVLAAQNELTARVWRAIRRLPQEQREALLLRDWHGLSYAEIAQALGVHVTTVNSRLHDAREKLRSQLGRYL